jgi:hypothetical protein
MLLVAMVVAEAVCVWRAAGGISQGRQKQAPLQKLADPLQMIGLNGSIITI